MTWKGQPPFVSMMENTYEAGMKVEMKQYESALERGKGIEKWFVKIEPQTCKKIFKIEQRE